MFTVCFFPKTVKWGHRKRKETNGWKIKNPTGCFLVQILSSCFVSKIVRPVPKIANEECFCYIYFTSDGHADTIISRHACMIIWCPECWKWHFRASRFQNFWGSMPPNPPRLRGQTAPCSYSRLFFSNQLPISNFVEPPRRVVFWTC